MPTLPMPSLTAPLLEWALWYSALGCRVFPCHTPRGDRCSCRKADCNDIGKHPRIKDWPNKASNDVTQIRQWWGMWPDANIGWLQGVTTWALDVDPKDGGPLTLEGLITDHGPLPRTPRSHTGSGGLHYLFAADTRVTNKVKFEHGLDTRSTGGYILVPPSLHVSGQRYTWDVDDDLESCAPQPAPDWLHTLVCTSQAQSTPVPDGPICEPGRNEALSKMAFAMRKAGMGISEILTALVQVNLRCIPPLDQAELEKIANGKANIGPDPVFKMHLNGTTATAASQPSWTDSTAWDAMVATTYPLRQWLIKGLIPHGLTIIGGPPKSRKSTIAYDLCLATVGQGLALNYWGCSLGGALYCTCEDDLGDSKTLVMNLRPQMPTTPAHPLRFANCDEVPTLGEGLLDYVCDQVTRYDLRLVVLDPLMYLLDQTIPRGVDPFLAMKRMLLPFHWLASELGFACVFVDHTRKASAQDPDSFTTLYGSQAKQAIAYTLIMVSREGDEIILETKGRGAGEHRFLFTCQQDPTTKEITWLFGGADNAMVSGSRQRLVLRAFARARVKGEFELGARDVVDFAELKQTPANYNNTRQVLFQLYRKGLLQRTQKGLFIVIDPSSLPSVDDDDNGVSI
jgi:hypothetical protein